MSHEIAKYLYEVSYPYKIDDALYFIKSSYDDFRLRKTITFAIAIKTNHTHFSYYVVLVVLKILIMLTKKQTKDIGLVNNTTVKA